VHLREAITGNAPSQATRIRTAWNLTSWHILFECEDTDPWATFTERDAPLFKEETVEVFLNPAADALSYFEIEVNPLNTVLDIVFRRTRSGYKGDWAWDCAGLLTRTHIAPPGWYVEMAIPFASIPADLPTPGAQWRVNFCRIDRPSRSHHLPREISAWSPPFRENFHTPERFGILHFASQK
jgi:hypothetical protein